MLYRDKKHRHKPKLSFKDWLEIMLGNCDKVFQCKKCTHQIRIKKESRGWYIFLYFLQIPFYSFFLTFFYLSVLKDRIQMLETVLPLHFNTLLDGLVKISGQILIFFLLPYLISKLYIKFCEVNEEEKNEIS